MWLQFNHSIPNSEFTFDTKLQSPRWMRAIWPSIMSSLTMRPQPQLGSEGTSWMLFRVVFHEGANIAGFAWNTKAIPVFNCKCMIISFNYFEKCNDFNVHTTSHMFRWYFKRKFESIRTLHTMLQQMSLILSNGFWKTSKQQCLHLLPRNSCK